MTNAEGTSLGSLNLYDATADSMNAVFARLTDRSARRTSPTWRTGVGITTPLPPVCALGTGSVGITPLDQASGYQTFANSGVHCTPYAVSEIRRNNKVLYDQTPDCQRVLAAPIANLVNKVLRGPVTYGTAASVFASGWGKWPIRGKTGTADSNKELWFAGYTRQVTTAVWVGSPHTPYPMPNYWGQSVFGGTIAAPIWKTYMLQILQGMPARQFPPRRARPGPAGRRHGRADGDPDAAQRRVQGGHQDRAVLPPAGTGAHTGSDRGRPDGRRDPGAPRPSATAWPRR